jgi:hypothetical protein
MRTWRAPSEPKREHSLQTIHLFAVECLETRAVERYLLAHHVPEAAVEADSGL